jgi:hypothetical protein
MLLQWSAVEGEGAERAAVTKQQDGKEWIIAERESGRLLHIHVPAPLPPIHPFTTTHHARASWARHFQRLLPFCAGCAEPVE